MMSDVATHRLTARRQFGELLSLNFPSTTPKHTRNRRRFLTRSQRKQQVPLRLTRGFSRRTKLYGKVREVKKYVKWQSTTERAYSPKRACSPI
ncbi:hypothetical protein TSUD_285370 [Trifolium subterraneum]|uniref:Uncharacterized protein n=1 Tax=Trifolium subterraneum TaxID=3900 RepID=A0A2Z6NXV5_TRISU|nr:hypothetical protein TSUD_285370 [Trifolium subterraneum]